MTAISTISTVNQGPDHKEGPERCHAASPEKERRRCRPYSQTFTAVDTRPDADAARDVDAIIRALAARWTAWRRGCE